NQKFCKEAVIWRHLRHPNILPLVGVTIGQGRCSMVSDWMENETINQFTRRNKDANRIDLLIDIVKGLMYMHKLHVVHGDLKGENVLINQDRRACLTDFGLSTTVNVDTHLDPNFLDANQRDSLMSFIHGGSYPWMSPELLDFDANEHRPTKESDIYALGMLIYEVLYGSTPFGDFANSAMIVVEITKGTRPGKPKDAASLGFTDGLWGTLERCWSAGRDARPTLEAVLSRLSEVASSWEDRWQVV
ncbi:kinase-like protein, partial [Thelephora ganbajun]